MGKFKWLIAVFVLIFCFALPVSATTGVTSLESHATVSADSSCQVSMNVTIRLEQPLEKLYFPIPVEATGVTLNGSRVSAARSGDVRRIDLSKLTKNVVGDVTVNIHYSLYDVIDTTEAGTLQMQIPMLFGFDYPVEALNFTVNMPGTVEMLPAFVSGYHQARIEEDLTYMVEGATITGSSLKALKDHETLTMTLAVTEEMFPQDIAHTQDYHFGLVAMGICAAVAMVYWLITMLNLPVWPQRSTEPPQGYTAGQLGCILTGQGVDLSLTVLSWAQLGYILIKTERGGQVLLYKRMDMGNERSEAERRLFKKLFGKRDMVDTASYSYAALCQNAAKNPAGIGELMRRFTGNPKIFRGLASGMGLFGGVSLAVAWADGAALQGVLVALMGLAGAFSGWTIQQMGCAAVMHSQRKATPGLIHCVAWLLIGMLSGAFSVAAWMVFGLLLAGMFFAWGGRRTDLGRQTLAQTLGLRHYLRKADKSQLQSLCQSDPDYFFRLAPYALALGADKAFAKRFGKNKLSGCPYLTSGMDGHMTAQQWSETMRRTLAAMDHRAEGLATEKTVRMIRSIIRQ